MILSNFQTYKLFEKVFVGRQNVGRYDVNFGCLLFSQNNFFNNFSFWSMTNLLNTLCSYLFV